MRDLLEDLDAGRFLSDPDPVRRAQIQMRTPLPKRFYNAVTVGAGADGFTVLLDGRTARTPARAALMLPTAAAARLVADEYDAQAEVVDPVTMPTTRLVNTAIDGVTREADAVAEDILRFSSSDMLCYRADGPDGLVRRQDDHWDPILDWAREALGARMNLAEGVVFVEQPRESIGAIRLHLARRRDALRLACLHLMTSITGSALIALAVEAGVLEAEAAWLAAHVDEDWQAEQWGQDAEAMARRNARKRDFLAAVRLVQALDPAPDAA
jgi:chaperone required for assembly of F1-ATPase